MSGVGVGVGVGCLVFLVKGSNQTVNKVKLFLFLEDVHMIIGRTVLYRLLPLMGLTNLSLIFSSIPSFDSKM